MGPDACPQKQSQFARRCRAQLYKQDACDRSRRHAARVSPEL